MFFHDIIPNKQLKATRFGSFLFPGFGVAFVVGGTFFGNFFIFLGQCFGKFNYNLRLEMFL
jgi:hypothetical protein